ncbi:MAG: DNA adenine methylase [Sulfolobales archaeon]
MKKWRFPFKTFFPSKTIVAEKIVRHFPVHRLYIEPFAGTGIVGIWNAIINKPQKSVINDINPKIYKHLSAFFTYEWEEIENAYKWLLPYLGTICKNMANPKVQRVFGNILETMKQTQLLLINALHEWWPGEDIYFIFAFPHLRSLDWYRKRYELVRQAKQNTKFEFYNEDALQLLTKHKSEWDKKDVVIYLDPPYVNNKGFYDYDVDGFDYNEFIALVESFQNAQVYLSEQILPSDKWVIIDKFQINNFSQSFRRRKLNKRVDLLLKLKNI